ncbi:MAG: hypothetical protein IKA08_01120 [Alphaproteobacteria bacterium]|nr:hypothetical protein [Alphaproteobacteria bacterium]
MSTNSNIVNARDFLGKIVNVQMDRPLGNKHSRHGFAHEVNYGLYQILYRVMVQACDYKIKPRRKTWELNLRS